MAKKAKTAKKPKSKGRPKQYDGKLSKVTLYVPEALIEPLRDMAYRDGHSLSKAILMVLTKHLMKNPPPRRPSDSSLKALIDKLPSSR